MRPIGMPFPAGIVCMAALILIALIVLGAL